MRPVVENNVLWIEDVGLFETGHHAERQVLAGVGLACNVCEGDRLTAERLHKIEPAALLENGTHDLLLNLGTCMRDRRPGPGMLHRAEDPVFVNEIAWSH